MEDCYTGYDAVNNTNCCNEVLTLNSDNVYAPEPIKNNSIEPDGDTPTGFNKLFAWVKENPIKAAAIGGGLWFLFFAGNKKQRRRK